MLAATKLCQHVIIIDVHMTTQIGLIYFQIYMKASCEQGVYIIMIIAMTINSGLYYLEFLLKKYITYFHIFVAQHSTLF